MPRLLLNPFLWLATTILWYATLFHLSGKSSPGPDVAFTIPHFDKVLHFGYFAIGGILLTTFILLKKGPTAPILFRRLSSVGKEFCKRVIVIFCCPLNCSLRMLDNIMASPLVFINCPVRS